MKIKAFTLIELLVVVSIIITISVSWVFYFSDFIENQELKQKLSAIEEDFQELDKEIENYSIFDYEISLSTTTGSLWYIVHKNLFDIEKNAQIDYDFSDETGTISIKNGLLSDLWNIEIFKKEKLFYSDSKNGNSSYIWNFSESPAYKVSGSLSGSTLNDIYIHYFADSNRDIEQWNLIELIAINSKEDKSWTSYTNLSIQSIWKKKTIGNNESEIYLFFENRGREDFIKIMK
jgi:type II secretory pathway pseudopilin PulG